MTQITANDPNLDGCPICGLIHLTETKHPGCAGHRPCRRRRPSGGRFCVACATTQAAAGTETLGPIKTYPVTNPLERLASLTGRVEGWMNVAEARLSRLTEFGGSDGQLVPELKAWAVIVRQLGFLLGLMSRLDLDERLIRLDRVQADQLRELLEVVMRDPELALSEGQQLEWPRAFARAARARVGPASSASVAQLTVDGEVA